MRVLLISGAISGKERYGNLEDIGAYLPPYGLCCLASVLENAGHEVKVIDSARYKSSYSMICEIIKEFSPDLLGMSVYSIGANYAIDTAKMIKRYFNIPIVAGGPHIIVYPDDFAQYDCFDYLVTGEGELSLLELINYLSEKRSLKEVKGIYYRQDGVVVKNDPRPFIENLDDLPFPAFHLIENLESYAPQIMVYRRKPIITLVTSRGCPYSCIFCNSVWTKKWRAHSARYVVDLVEYVIKRFGAREVSFHEDTFALDRERVLEICRMMKERNLNIIWTATVNLKTLDREVIRAMREAGCWLVSCGIESGNDDVLKFIQKPIDKESVRRVIGWLDEAGIKVRGYFMIGHLIDTKETIEETIEFTKSLPIYSMNMSIMYLSPGSRVKEIAHKYGSVDDSLELGTGYPRGNLSFVPRGMTREYLQEMQKKAISDFFFRPTLILRLLSTFEGLEDIKRYARLTKAFVKLSIHRFLSKVHK